MRIEGPAVLPLRWGQDEATFTLFHFDVDGDRWAAVYTGDLGSGEPVPLRIESACLFGHVLRSAQCDCGYQLEQAMQEFCRTGRGLLVYGIDQDARGLGTEAHFAIYRMRQQEELDTDELYRRLDAPVDARDYTPVAAILRHLGVDSVVLLSNNPKRAAFLREHGVSVVHQALEAPLTVHNMSTLMLEKEDLGYSWSFETHADWLEPMQAEVDGLPDVAKARLVSPGRGVPEGLIAEATDDGQWSLARSLAGAVTGPLPEGLLVVYLTELPRVDEIQDYAKLGASVVVVPFAHIPPALRRADPAVKVVDWARRNAYRTDRPQWTLIERSEAVDVYRRGDRVRLFGAVPEAPGAARSGDGWVEYPLAARPTLPGLKPVDKGRTVAVSRADGTRSTSDALSVDTADCAPQDMARFATMNPFHFDPASRIPVPGTELYASSMESVWQGLKLVDGELDLGMFGRPPVKRPPDAERGPDHHYAATTFRLGDDELDIVTARLRIYLPAYLYVLEHLVPDEVIEEIDAARTAGVDVRFYDWDDNFDIADPDSSFSHSAVLAAWFGGRLEDAFLRHYRAVGGAVDALPLARYRSLHGLPED